MPTFADLYDSREATIKSLFAQVGLTARLKELGYTACVTTDLMLGRITATSHSAGHKELSAAIAVVLDASADPWMEWTRKRGGASEAEATFDIRDLGGLDRIAALADGAIRCPRCCKTTETGLSVEGKCQACLEAEAARYQD